MLRVFVAFLALFASLAGPAAAASDYEIEAAGIAKLTAAARYAEALATTEALAARLADRDAKSADYARALGWQAYLNQVQGRFTDAEPLFKKSLDLLEKALPPGHADVATAINNLGFQYQATDRLDEAEELYKRALVLREMALPKSALAVADSLNNLAQVYKGLGRVAEAEPLLRRALEMRTAELPATNPLIAQSLANLAGTLELQGRASAAEPLLRKALEIRRAAQGADHPEVAGITSRIGQNLSRQQKYAEAEAMLETALAMRMRSQPSDHVDIAGTLQDMGRNLLALSRVGEARSALERALAIRRAALPVTHPDIPQTIADLARTSLAANNRQAAAAEVRQGIAILLSRDRVDDIARRQMADFIALAWELFGSDPRAIPIEILDQTLQMGQRATWTPTASAVSRMAARFATKDAGLQRLILDRDNQDALRLSLEKDLIATLAGNAANRAGRAAHLRADLAAAEQKIAAVDHQLKRDFPDYFALVRPEPLKVDAIRALLAGDEAMVSFVTTPGGLYVWAVTKDRVSWRRIELTREALAARIATLRDALDVQAIAKAGISARLFDLGLAHDLYRALLEPVGDLIKDKRQLIVVASGPLTGLPFQLLVATPPAVARPSLTQLAEYRNADWLIRRHAISVLPAVDSLMALRRVAGRPAAAQALIGFGNPVFGHGPVAAGSQSGAMTVASNSDSGGVEQIKTRGYSSYWRGPAADLEALRRDLPPLPETEAELKTVADGLDREHATLMLGAAATETAVKSAELDRYRIVYFATHGLVAGEVRGLGEPALALTLPETLSDVDDGLLTASEVAQLRLDADWVVLSACNTAAGEKPGADALSGLARSFFHAGARAMLVSHWRVGSDATAKLMTTTFGELARSPAIGRAEALRQAMITISTDEKDPWSGYPTFWGAFSLIGEGQANVR